MPTTQLSLTTLQLSLLLVNNLTTAYYCPDNLTVVWIANYLKINNNSKEYYKKKIIDLRADITKDKETKLTQS